MPKHRASILMLSWLIVHYAGLCAEGQIVLPKVSTYAAESITQTSALLKAGVVDDGGESCRCRFQYWQAGQSRRFTHWISGKTTHSVYASRIPDFDAAEDKPELKPTHTIYYVAEAENSAGATLGDIRSVTLLNVIYVDGSATGANDGTSWVNAYVYLQDALAGAMGATKPGVIFVAQGVYQPDRSSVDPTGTGDRRATFQLINGVTIQGGYAGLDGVDPNERDISLYETILSGDLDGNDVDVNDLSLLSDAPSRGDNSYHVVTASEVDPNAILDGFTVTGGNPAGDDISGGGMLVQSASPTVTTCTFRGNYGRWPGGGGLCAQHQSMVLMNCTFVRNAAPYGGGAYFSHTGPYSPDHSQALITNCDFVENWSTYGGAGFNAGTGGSPAITGCTFRGNVACWGGGGVGSGFSPEIPLLLTRCRFIENTAIAEGLDHGGGAIMDTGAGTVVSDCLFVRNQTLNTGSRTGSGGAVYAKGSGTTLTNCTFVSNQGGNGNALACTGYFIGWADPPYTRPGMLDVSNCILWDGGNELWQDPNGTVTVTYSDVDFTGRFSYPGLGNIAAEPGFADPELDDYRLTGDSLCVDRGDPNHVGEPQQTDFDGNTRIIDGDRDGLSVVDMGAYEFDPGPVQ